jgi:hypothetical protein
MTSSKYGQVYYTDILISLYGKFCKVVGRLDEITMDKYCNQPQYEPLESTLRDESLYITPWSPGLLVREASLPFDDTFMDWKIHGLRIYDLEIDPSGPVSQSAVVYTDVTTWCGSIPNASLGDIFPANSDRSWTNCLLANGHPVPDLWNKDLLDAFPLNLSPLDSHSEGLETRSHASYHEQTELGIVDKNVLTHIHVEDDNLEFVNVKLNMHVTSSTAAPATATNSSPIPEEFQCPDCPGLPSFSRKCEYK